jgi:hypothetical protein
MVALAGLGQSNGNDAFSLGPSLCFWHSGVDWLVSRS